MLNDPLLECLRLLFAGNGTYRFFLLRETRLDASCINAGDIDLLASPRSIRAMIAHLYELALQGHCNVRIGRPSPGKVRLSLYSSDMHRRIDFDLWTEIWQLEGGSRALRFEHVRKFLPAAGPALARLPLELEACVYLEHLQAKQKDLPSPAVTERLVHYEAACAKAGDQQLANAFAKVRNESGLDAATMRMARQVIGCSIDADRWLSLPRRALRRLVLRRYRLADARRSRTVAFIGCDGVGKTSIAQEVAAAMKDRRASFMLGKDLYRLGVPFRAFYKLNRMSLGLTRETIDEWLHPIAYLCALLSLRKSVKAIGDRVLLIDRSPADFMYVGRKSDAPRFSRLSKFLSLFRRSLPVVHLVVPFEVLESRKNEMTPSGQELYDLDMLQYHAMLPGADYLLFRNAGSLADAAEVLTDHVNAMYPPVIQVRATRRVPGAAVVRASKLTSSVGN